jgi:O-antigen/teichoic acid export membrane protein
MDSGVVSTAEERVRSFGQNTVTVFIGEVFIVALKLVTVVFIGRALGAEGQGIFSLVLLGVGIATMVGTLGMETAIVHFIGQKKAAPREVVGNALLIALALGGTMMALGMLAAGLDVLPTHRFNWNAFTLLAAPAVPAMLCHSALGSALLGQYRVGTYISVRSVQAVVLLGATAWLLANTHLGYAAPIVAYTASVMTGALVAAVVVARLGFFSMPKFSRTIGGSIVRYGMQGYWGTLFQFLNYRVDQFIVALFWGEKTVGYYAVAVMLAEAIWYIPNSVSTVLLPKAATSAPEKTNAMTAMVARNSLFITLLACAGVAVFGGYFIEFAWRNRPDYVAAVTPMRLLLPGVLFLGLWKILANDLAGRGFPQYKSWTAGAALAVTLALDFALIPIWGNNGAAIASSVAYTVSATMLLGIFCKLTGVGVWEMICVKPSDFRVYARQLLHRGGSAKKIEIQNPKSEGNSNAEN